MKCNGDCFNCKFDDCINELSEQDEKELQEIEEMVKEIRKIRGYSMTSEYNKLKCRRHYIMKKEERKKWQRDYRKRKELESGENYVR